MIPALSASRNGRRPVHGVFLLASFILPRAGQPWGESLPVDKAVGDSVFSGTINRFGSIDIEAAKVGEDSSLQKLIRMVQDAEENQAPGVYFRTYDDLYHEGLFHNIDSLAMIRELGTDAFADALVASYHKLFDTFR